MFIEGPLCRGEGEPPHIHLSCDHNPTTPPPNIHKNPLLLGFAPNISKRPKPSRPMADPEKPQLRKKKRRPHTTSKLGALLKDFPPGATHKKKNYKPYKQDLTSRKAAGRPSRPALGPEKNTASATKRQPHTTSKLDALRKKNNFKKAAARPSTSRLANGEINLTAQKKQTNNQVG